MKIYTKTGDDGQTGLLGGDRTPKTSLRIKAIGKVDTLNAALGVAMTTANEKMKGQLSRIQCTLFDIGAELACPPDGKFEVRSLSDSESLELENEMDEMTAHLAPLKQFILPGGTATASSLHLARGLCREAEIAVLDLNDSEPARSELIMYLNRLSDWLFTAARSANKAEGVEDQIWNQRN